jgi:hypothetical protein
MSDTATIYREAKSLNPVDRLRLVEMLLADLDQPDDHIDRIWAAEAMGSLSAW